MSRIENRNPVVTTIEISRSGKMVRVPALPFQEKILIVEGSWLRTATIHDEEWLATGLEDPETCIGRLKEGPRPLAADLFTFAQQPPAVTPRYRYHMEPDSIAVTPIPSFRDWWDKLPQETRKNVRRSQKRGVDVRIRQLDNDLVQQLVELNNDSPMRQGRRNYHYGKSFEQVREDNSSFPDRSELIGAYAGEELIGFLKLVYRGEIASVLTLLTRNRDSDKRPANALLARAVELCCARGVSHLTYGLFNYGNKGDSPLREFKIRNGFDEMLVPRFYVPLTVRGTICMKLNLHRGLLGVLPHRAIAIGLNARTRWYNYMQPSSRCSLTPEQPNRYRQMGCSNPPAGSNL